MAKAEQDLNMLKFFISRVAQPNTWYTHLRHGNPVRFH